MLLNALSRFKPCPLLVGILVLFLNIWLIPLSMAAAKLKPLTIQEVISINFGVLVAEDGICTMSSGGVLSGSNGQTCSGVQTPAQFTVGGSNNRNVIIGVTSGSASGVTFNPVVDGPSLITLSGGGSIDVLVIGDLVVSNAAQGAIQVPYTFSVNYE